MRDRRDWRGVLRPGRWLGVRAIAWAVALLAVTLGTAILCSLAAKMIGVPHGGGAATVVLAMTLILVLGAYAGAVWLGEQRPVTELAARQWPELLLGLAGGLGAFALVMGLLLAIGAYGISAPPPGPPWTGLAIGFGPGVVEELIFRGVLMRLLWEAFGPRLALVVSSIAFGLAHLVNPSHSLMGALSIIVEAGLTLGAIFVLTGRLWATIGVHAGWNFTQGYVFGATVSGVDPHGSLFRVVPRPGMPALLTGGAFGPEASLAAVLVGGAAAALLLVVAKRRAAARWPVP